MTVLIIIICVIAAAIAIAIAVLASKCSAYQKESAELNKSLDKKIKTINGTVNSLSYEISTFPRKITNEIKTEIAKSEKESKLFAEELNHSSTETLEEKISTLADVLSSVIEENNQFRAELEEQRKKLNFYANIEADSAELNIKDDAEERERLLEIVSQQLKQRKENKDVGLTVNDAESANTDYSTESIPKNETNDTVSDIKGKLLLDSEQEKANDIMNETHDNLFITGKAGTGKSFLLDTFRRNTTKNHVVIAPTGIAALNVHGATIHSVFGYFNLVNLNVEEISLDSIKLKSEKMAVLRNVETIIIDEISMVRADTFDKIDRILKAINHNDLPFGGKQMLVFGDLFQLPPVVKSEEMNYLMDKYGGTYFYHSDAYKAGDFKFIELKINHRQKEDQAFFEILNRIREGKVTDDDIDVLNDNVSEDESAYDRFVTLFPTKAEAEAVNREHLERITGSPHIYKAKVVVDKSNNKNKNLETVFPITDELKLKNGALVMMVSNDPEHRWVNGTLGIVKDLSDDVIKVSIDNRTFEVVPCEFTEQEITYKDGKIKYEDVYKVSQYPIVLAYAITIHKSQGQTYKNIVCDVDRCFTSGQAYVALSRCASLEGLHLKSKINRSNVMVDSDVLNFYLCQSSNSLLGN